MKVIDGIVHNWEAYLACRPSNKRRRERWSPSFVGTLKFNLNGVARGKACLASIGGVLHNHQGWVCLSLSKDSGVEDSNEVEILAILKALRLYVHQ